MVPSPPMAKQISTSSFISASSSSPGARRELVLAGLLGVEPERDAGLGTPRSSALASAAAGLGRAPVGHHGGGAHRRSRLDLPGRRLEIVDPATRSLGQPDERLQIALGAGQPGAGVTHDGGSERLGRLAHARAGPSGGAPRSRTTPPLPTCPRPTSNCGLIRARQSKRLSCARQHRPEDLAQRDEGDVDHDQVGGVGKIRGVERPGVLALDNRHPLIRAQRASSALRRPRPPPPRAALPAASRQSVKPPVEAPTSSASAIRHRDRSSASRALASLIPPRETNSGGRATSQLDVSAGRAGPACGPALAPDPGSTSPARTEAAARAREGKMPRSDSRESIRTRFTPLQRYVKRIRSHRLRPSVS